MKAYINWVISFMARGPYRLLVFLLFGVAVIVFGIWHDWDKLMSGSIKTKLVCFGGLVFYLVASCVYGYLIYTDRWKTAFWDVVLKARNNPEQHP